MPSFIPNFTEIKGFASSFNLMGVFGDTHPAPPSAEAGPGPSTQAAQAAHAAKARPLDQPRLMPSASGTTTLHVPNHGGPSPSRPIRPSLKNTNSTFRDDSSSSDSQEDGSAKRRSSGTNVMIVDPEVDFDDERMERRRQRSEGLQGVKLSRPMSASSGLTGISVEPRRRRKTPLDTYIIVKPPPTSAKNPLNLQIQLVVKNDLRARDRSASGALSIRSASTATDITPASVTPSPETATSDLPPPTPATLSDTDVSSTIESPMKLRSASPVAYTRDDGESPAKGAQQTPLRRSSSLKSSVSVGTTGSNLTGGGKKRVEPMFNLAVHSVMHHTVVTDAATDAKVAKFLKRNLDITGVGCLEPAEVWLPPSNTSSFTALGLPAADEPRSRPVSMLSLTSPLSPTTTSIAPDSGVRGSIDATIKRSSLDLRNFKIDVAHEGGAKKFFGKVFKKKVNADNTLHVEPQMRSRSSSFHSHEATEGLGQVANPGAAGRASISQAYLDLPHGVGHPTFGTAPVVVRRRSSGTIVTPDGAVTGLTATINVPPPTFSTSPPDSILAESVTTLHMAPSNRPIGYTWTVNKWAKKNSEGWGAQLLAAGAAGLELVHGAMNGDTEDEVVFEWVKLKSAKSAGTDVLKRFTSAGTVASGLGPAPRAKERRSRVNSEAPDATPTSSTLTVKPATRDSSLPPSPNPSILLDRRPQPVRRVSAASGNTGSNPGSRRASLSPGNSPPKGLGELSNGEAHETDSTHTAELTAEEDSDPEDSETPWTCSIWVKKTGQRQLLGTLTPAPHHPKVIGVLKIPMGLDPVSLTDVKAHPDQSTKQEELAHRVKSEVALTEENLKDVVCVTAMWLVAREEFGGLGKKRREKKEKR